MIANGGRYICSAEKPWNKTIGGQARHPDAEEIAEDLGGLCDGGSRIKYRCPNCKIEFWAQLPD